MITHKRKLRTDGTLWQHVRAPQVPVRALTRDASAEVLIVGAGITGAMIGEALAEAGVETIIVDRRRPAQGSPSRAPRWSPTKSTCRSSSCAAGSEARPIRAWRRSRLAVSNLASYFDKRGLEAQSRGSLYLSGNRLGARDLRREGELRRAAGIETAFLHRGALRARFGIDHAAALLGPGNLTINPRAVTARLLIRAQTLGARIHSPAEISDLERGRSFWIASTKKAGASAASMSCLRAATNFPSSCRSQATTSRPPGRSRPPRSRASCGRSNASSGKPLRLIFTRARRRMAACCAGARTRIGRRAWSKAR